MPSTGAMWTPPDTRTPLTAFTETVAERHGLAGTDYETLRAFSVTSTALFWSSVWDFCQIIHSAPYTSVIDETLSIDTVPRWFAGARLNYCENLLRPEFTGLALISAGESQNYGQLTHQQLAMRVGQCARALQHAGIITGDRVAAYVPNCIESVIFFLATVSLGAIWSSTSPDFGVAGVLDRFRQIEPKLLVSVNAVTYNGKDHDHSQKLKLVVQGLPSLTRVVVFSLLEPITDVSDIPNAVTCRQFLQAFPLELPVCAQLPFDHPLVIVFSSGTTGKPKCIVHSHGGALIQHLKEHVLHGGMGPEDVFFYYTTTGWMMWNWLVSGLATGATIVLYDGSPFKPSPARLFELVDEFKITHFGTSAKYIQALEDAHFHPAKHFSLSSLKMIYSTGSPLKPESFDFVFNHIKRNVCLGSITGGTDIISLFAGHNISSPVHRGEIQCRSLGMSIEAWDDSGKPVMDQPGDLVCTKPFPVMPVYFWNDENGEKYKQAYFSNYKGVWYHGDYLQISSKTGGVVMLGRSDGTLNPAGVRFGSAELYNIVAEFPEIQDSLAVGQKQGQDERVVLFCKMATNKPFDADLVQRLKTRIRSLLSSRHVPALVLPIADIPYTLTGKKVEVAVKKIISGQTVVPSSALANPESLALFYGIRELTISSL